MKLAFTGHRPARFGLDYSPESNRILTRFAATKLAARTDASLVISGMALGFDQAVAHVAVVLGIRFVAAVPFPGQQGRWPDHAK